MGKFITVHGHWGSNEYQDWIIDVDKIELVDPNKAIVFYVGDRRLRILRTEFQAFVDELTDQSKSNKGDK